MSTAELERLSPAHAVPRAPELRVPRRGERRRPFLPGALHADGVASLFPAARPCDDVRTAPALRRANAFDAPASATAWIIVEGLAMCDSDVANRIIEGWCTHQQDSLAPLVTDGGCDVRIGRRRAVGALRMALLAWLPLTFTDLAVYEGGLFRDAPANAITLLIRPPTIWSMSEALLAERLFPRGSLFTGDRFATLERYACARLGSDHLTRLREAVSRIERQLPFEKLPVASEIVAAGCGMIAADDDRCAAIGALQLARFATSAVVAEQARRGR